MANDLMANDPTTRKIDGPRAGFHYGREPVARDFELWHDVFVEQELPWGRFAQSVLVHTVAVGLIWAMSLAWLRQQNVLVRPVFDRSSLITYSPQEYLPPLDTGTSEAAKTQKGDPVYAAQPILSVPREANSAAQTIVVPPDIKLNNDVELPNIIATGTVVPAVPLDATHANLSRIRAPETQVIAPSPELELAQDRLVRAAMKSEIIAPPPEIHQHQVRGLDRPEAAVIEPPPDLAQPAKGKIGSMNMGPSAVVAPAPQLAVEEQHLARARGAGSLSAGSLQPVAPAPSVSASGGGASQGRLIALGIHPVAPSGPVAVPSGNRRGTFAATPQGRAGATGTPDLIAANRNAKGSGSRGDGASGSGVDKSALPAGLRVGAADSRGNEGRENAGEATPRTSSGNSVGARAASAVSDDKITDFDRQVFRGKRPYAMTLNMPNLNSSTGSWEIRFAEVDQEKKSGDLLAPVAVEKSDPGYPLELIRANVHGMVTLYAVIGADGKVAEVRVLNSPDDRLDAYAKKALSRCIFAPAERAGKPVALEAVVRIPFRVRRSF